MPDMTEGEFRALVGRDPEQDDLERANCVLAGRPMHRQCGRCGSCGMPRFMPCNCAKDRAGVNLPSFMVKRPSKRPVSAPDLPLSHFDMPAKPEPLPAFDFIVYHHDDGTHTLAHKDGVWHFEYDPAPFYRANGHWVKEVAYA